MDVEPVWLRGRRHRSKPPVEDSKLRNQGFVNSDLIRFEPVHDILGHVRVHGVRLLGEPVHRGRVGGRVVGSEYLLPDGLEGVARVRVDVVGLVAEVEERGGRVGGGERVGFGPGDPVDLRVEFLHPAQHVVEGAVLHDHHHDGLDWTG